MIKKKGLINKKKFYKIKFKKWKVKFIIIKMVKEIKILKNNLLNIKML